MTEPPMLMIGLMSGTSLDGVDAALVRVRGPGSVELMSFVHRPYRPEERARIAAVLAGSSIAETARLHGALSEWACEAIDTLLEASHVRADTIAAIAFPGQTMWHEPPVVTFQLGEPAIIAERFGVRVVHNFRSRDVAAGGQGAPLVPMVDALCFGAVNHPRLLLNIGGMANVTWVPARADLDAALGADCGPGVAIVDEIARMVEPGLPYDVDGAIAARGTIAADVLADLLNDPFFAAPPPRSTGRERFGREYAERLHARVPGADGVRTAVALTVESIAGFGERHMPPAGEMIVAGGGAHHPVLMESLATRLGPSGTKVLRFDEVFFDGDAKEAVAFAFLGWLTVHGQPGNLPRVTGADGARVLGCITPA